MDVRTRVVQVRRPGLLDALRLQQRKGQLFRELTVDTSGKKIGDRVDIDHRHAHPPSNRRAIAAAAVQGAFARADVQMLGIC